MNVFFVDWWIIILKLRNIFLFFVNPNFWILGIPPIGTSSFLVYKFVTLEIQTCHNKLRLTDFFLQPSVENSISFISNAKKVVFSLSQLTKHICTQFCLKKSLLKHFRENEIDFKLLREETIINVWLTREIQNLFLVRIISN